MQNGGLLEYIVSELQVILQQLDHQQLIRLLTPDIEEGYIYENLEIPKSP